jgi:isocitrate dehydrogenase (NAD+)
MPKCRATIKLLPDLQHCINMFGDILSDLTPGLVGGLGLIPGANIGDEAILFEAIHGSAPDIAGKNLANPIVVIMAAVMMLNHIGDTQAAERVKNAEEMVNEGKYVCLILIRSLKRVRLKWVMRL